MARIYVTDGSDARRMTMQLLQAARPELGLDKNVSIGLKPNLVVAKGYKSGATTNPVISEAIIEYFAERGYNNLKVIESSWLAVKTKDAFKVCGYDDLAKRYGIELIDVKKDSFKKCEFRGMEINISQRAFDIDYLINLPLIKGHCQTKITCALKNLKGLIPDSEKRRFHAMGLHKPIAYLNKMIYPSLTIADGIYTDPDFEEGGNPAAMNTMIAGTDSVLIDAYAADLLGYCPEDIEYIKIAADIGVGSSDLSGAEIVHIGKAALKTEHKRSKELESAASHITQSKACSSCYGNLANAIVQMEKNHDLGSLHISVGQGYREKNGTIGCGNCTNGFDYCIKGCPPSTEEIVEGIKRYRRDI